MPKFLIAMCIGLYGIVYLILLLYCVDRAPVWHFVSRRGAACGLLTPQIQTKWPQFILFIPARCKFSFVYIFLTQP